MHSENLMMIAMMAEPSDDLRCSERPREAQRARANTKERVKGQERVGTGDRHGQKCAETGVLSTFWREEKQRQR